MPARITPKPSKEDRARMRKLFEDTAEFDAPRPPRPAPPLFIPPYARDRAFVKPIGCGPVLPWEQFLADIEVLEPTFRNADLTKVRLVTELEIQLCRRVSGLFRRRHPIPCIAPGATARCTRLNQFALASPDGLDVNYVTTAPYPAWLTDDSLRRAAFEELTLEQMGL